MTRWSGPALAAVLLAGCSLGPDYRRPDTAMPAAWRATAETAAAAWPSPDWWRGFSSPTLDRLMAEARAYNFDIAAAASRVREADAAARIAGAPLLPTLGAQGGATWEHTGSSSTSSLAGGRYRDIRQYSALGVVGYETDFWGKNRETFRSAEASAVASRFDQQTVALTVMTSVAQSWFNALAYQDRLAVARDNLRDSERTLRVIQTRLEVGTATALDVAQQAALVEGVRATIPNLKSQMEQAIIGLGILTGRPPQAVDVPPGTLTELTLPEIYPGLPSDLLARRPDVAYAEANLVAANANIKAARAAFFPSISLTGQGGYSSLALSTLFGPGAVFGAIATSLTQPIFDGGTLRGQLEQNRARYDELAATYRKAVVQSFTDVETALTAYRYATEQQALQQRAVDIAQRAADIARAQVAAGTVDITTVLQAQATLYSDQDTLVQVRLARFLSLLNLYIALGGGWTRPDGTVLDQFPGLSPGLVPGGIALPVGDNLR